MSTFASCVVLVSVSVAAAACGPPGLPPSPSPASPAAGHPHAAQPVPTAPGPADLRDAYREVLASRDLEGVLVGPLPEGKRATVFVVFASWCGACRRELVVLSELVAEQPAVRVIGINAYEEWGEMSDAARLREYVAAHAPWLQVVRADDALMAALGTPPKIPTLFVFDRAGGLVRAFLRARRPAPGKEELSAVIAEAIRAGQ